MNAASHRSLEVHAPPALPLVERLLSKVGSWRFLSVSLALHLALVVLLGGVVLFHAVQPVEDFTASGGSVLSSGDEGTGGPPEPPAAIPQDLPPMEVATVTPDTTLQVLTAATTNPTAFSVAPAAVAPSGQSMGGAAARMRSGGSGGLPGVGAGSGGLRGSFFGVKSRGRHIAFLIDYSGSMDGPFREAMEKELERCLRDPGSAWNRD